jgi:Na+-translocating ferredoxin:NAD+ oxidoreductase RnfG subunit
MKQPTLLSSLFALATVVLLFCALLTFANRWTEPRIAAWEQTCQAAQQARSVRLLQPLFPEATAYEKIGSTVFLDSTADYFCIKKGSDTIGFAIHSFGRGFQSIIHVVACVNTDFSIRNVEILHEAETEGLGAQMREPAFLAQFRGKRPESLRVITEDAPADTNAIVAITMATISSRALVEGAVKKGILFLKKEMGR